MPVDFARIQGPAPSATTNFEKLCALLVTLEFPDAHAVDGKGGDGGVDAFLRKLPERSMPNAVFQFKFFTGTLQGSQKRQIEDALKSAIKSSNPEQWTLCIPKAFTPSEHVWWDRLVSDHQKEGRRLQLWDDTILRQKVLQHADVCEEFFPERFTKTQQRQLKSIVSRVAAISVCLALLGGALFTFFPRNRGMDHQSQVPYDPSRPKDLLPQAFYLRHDNIPVKGFPFDLYLGMKLEDFEIRYGSLVKEEPLLFPDLNLYRLKPNTFKPDRKGGSINEESTTFLFENGELVLLTLDIVIPPDTETALLGELDRSHPIGFGDRYEQLTNFIWMSEKGHALEMLNLTHGLSSGANDFTLIKTDFPLNDLLLKLTPNVPRIPTVMGAFRILLSQLRNVLASDVYKDRVLPQLGLADVNRLMSLQIIDQALGDQ